MQILGYCCILLGNVEVFTVFSFFKKDKLSATKTCISCCGIFEKNESWVQWPFLCSNQFNKIKNLLIQTIAPLVSKMYIFGHNFW